MAVRITNQVETRLYLSSPINDYLSSRQTRDFSFVPYDDVVNEPSIAQLEDEGKIIIQDLDAALPYYDSVWTGPNKFRLGTNHIWVDALGSMRMKIGGDATHDLDGVVIGPGGTPSPHGATHVFNGTDPVPDIEVLENAWTCPINVQVLDVVYQAGSGTCSRAIASSTAGMPAIGVCINKPSGSSCIIARSGEVPGFSGLTPDTYYYVSDTAVGGITPTPPSGGGTVIQQVGYARTSSILVVELSRPLKKV